MKRITANMVAFGVGCAALGVGLWMVYPPAAWIVEGAILIGISLFGERRV